MFISHPFSIEIVYEPYLTHIINQTMINLCIGLATLLLFSFFFFTTEPICMDFESLNILCLRAGDLTRLARPHFLKVR
jgi:hypothetical protein